MIVSIGIDVAKLKLDVYSDSSHYEVENTKQAIRKLFLSWDTNKPVVMEATGKYHRLAHEELVALGFEVMIINPYQGRHFAKAMNLFCKTDAVDAKLLALYGDKMAFKTTPLASEVEQELQELTHHLSDLEKTRRALQARAREASGFIKKSLDKPIKALDKEIALTEDKLKEHVKHDSDSQAKCELLCSIPGIQIKTAIMLLSHLRELGTLTKNEIAALAGVAPMNNDSGTMRGKRCIRGGRHDVRAKLYMPTMGAATQHNPRLKKIYERLVSNGRPKKVALIACMRKLITWANAMLATQQTWQNATV
jgi:transposase